MKRLLLDGSHMFKCAPHSEACASWTVAYYNLAMASVRSITRFITGSQSSGAGQKKRRSRMIPTAVPLTLS